MPADESMSLRRLSDLRRAAPADATLQNLLAVLSEKLELCSRLPIYEYEASSEGHGRTAEAFRALAEVERRSFNELLACLRNHLQETTGSDAAADSQEFQEGGFQ